MSSDVFGFSPRVVADFMPGTSGQEVAPRIMSDRLKDAVEAKMDPEDVPLIIHLAQQKRDRGSSREDVQNYLQSSGQLPYDSYEIANFLFTAEPYEAYNFTVGEGKKEIRFRLVADAHNNIRLERG